MPESRIARADRRTTAILLRIGGELRVARLGAGLTLQQVAHAVGISRSEASRIERGDAPWVDVTTLIRLAAAVGLDVWVRAFPGNEPIRDTAHLRLAEAFLRLVAAPIVVRSEVAIGDRSDLRAWDMTLADATGRRCGVELETRFIDAQAQHRRISQKLTDSGFDLVLVVVADTRANRAAVRAAAGYLKPAYAIDDTAASEALRNGRLPLRSAVIFVPVPRRIAGHSHPAGAADVERPIRRSDSRGTAAMAPSSRGMRGSAT